MNDKAPTAGIILAAGCSKRLGRPKQLVQMKGRTLIERIVDAALNSELTRIVLVLGHRHEAITRLLNQKLGQKLGQKTDPVRFNIVINRHHPEGLSSSLSLGLAQVKNTHASVMFLLGDQPLLDAPAINALLTAFQSSKKDICVPVQDKKRGNPTIFSRHFYASIMEIQGDSGARRLIGLNPSCVHHYHTKNPAYFFDIDTEANVRAWQTMIDPAKHVKMQR